MAQRSFVIGWLLGLAVVGAIVLLIGGSLGATAGRQSTVLTSTLKLVLGIVLLVLAVRQWRGRPEGDEEPPAPKWMGAVEAFTPVKALGAGALVAGANPKNTVLAIAAAAGIAASGLSAGQQVVAYAIFAILATLGVGAPVVIYFALGERAAPLLENLKQWMQHNNAGIMTVLLLVIGAKLIGDAIAGF
jgi:threonine/homoserine/homoserine lactone efflux protein